MNTLKAEKRNMQTKAKRLRRKGFVTGNVFGKEIQGSIPIQMTKKDVEVLLKSAGKGSRIVLDISGENRNVLIKEIDYDSMKHQVLEIDFQELIKGEKVHSSAEVVLLNHDKVTSGIVELDLQEILYRALPEALVEKVEIDLNNRKVGDEIKVKDLAIASDREIELQTNPEETVVRIVQPRNTTIPEEETDDTDGEM